MRQNITPTNRHAERYKQRTEPWTGETTYNELVRRIQEATGVTRERAHELAKAHEGKFAVTLDGQLRGPDHDDRGDPFGRTVNFIANIVDEEGKAPEPRTPEQIQEVQRRAVGYSRP